MSESLVADLLTWFRDMAAVRWSGPVVDRQEQRQRLEQQGRALAVRLQTEVGARFRVRYVP